MQVPTQDLSEDHIFTGNIYIFQAFDIGNDIDLDAIKKNPSIISKQLVLPKYFKNYHIPLAVDFSQKQIPSKFISCTLHNFGTVSFIYKVPFKSSLTDLRAKLSDIENGYEQKSLEDVTQVFNNIKPFVTNPTFFQMRSSYLVIQVNPEPKFTDIPQLKNQFSGVIASMLRFETETLAEFQKNEIMEDAIGYFRGDLIVVDTEAAFVYDEEYEELIPFFEFANIQLLELQYFDRLLDKQLTLIYEEKLLFKLPFTAYLPFIGSPWGGIVRDLGRLRVEISVISERLESSIKLVGEAYFYEFYNLIVEKFDLRNWQESINKKLTIIEDLRDDYQKKVDDIREDMLSVLIIILILIETIVAITK